MDGDRPLPFDGQQTFRLDSDKVTGATERLRPLPQHAKSRFDASVEELEEELSQIAQKEPWVPAVRNVLKVLIEQKGVRPSALHYEATILANCEAEHGSLSALYAILREMEQESVAIGLSVLTAGLKVLAIHPDYLLRTSILERIQQQWMTLAPIASHYVIAGLIREGQLELAMAKTQEMHKQRVPIEPWLDTLMMYTLCHHADFDAVLRFIYSMEDERKELTTYTWHYILDRASQHLHLETTKLAWDMMVEPFYIMPSTGLCYNVLLTAARNGDPILAESVIRVLSHRHEPTLLECELVLEAYVEAEDTQGAARVRSLIEKLERSGKEREAQTSTENNDIGL